jgi:nucleoside-diphosphate-sugar epimerase
MTRFLVTGVTGRVGSTLAATLLSRGHEVRGLVAPGDPARGKLQLLPDLEIIEADLGDRDGVEAAVAGVDAVLHMAAKLIRRNEPVDSYFDTNTMGTIRLVNAAARTGVKRFVHASTDGAYDFFATRSGPITEDEPQQPCDYYGTSKTLAEEAVRGIARQWDLPYTILRFASVVAPNEVLGCFRRSYAGAFLGLSRHGRDTHLWQLFEGWPDPESSVADIDPAGDPAVVVADRHGNPWAIHLTDVRDAVTGVLLAVENPVAVGETFHIVGPASTPWTEGAREVSAALNLPLHTITAQNPFCVALCHDKATALIGYQPEWNFARMVASGIEWQSGNRPADVLPAGME